MEEFEESIPRCEMELLVRALETETRALDTDFELTACGSFRRGHSLSLSLFYTLAITISTSPSPSTIFLSQTVYISSFSHLSSFSFVLSVTLGIIMFAFNLETLNLVRFKHFRF